MPGNNYFNFKQFTVLQEKTAMRVGIDGVLLGAWATVNHKKRILDIGTGTGLIALMMAQRNQNALVDAVEIDQDASDEANFNFQNSPWGNRLQIYHQSFQEFASQCHIKYDLIISNPPYFANSVNLKNESRAKARSSDFLRFEELLVSSLKILSDSGIIAVIYPYENLQRVKDITLKYGMHLSRIMHVKPSSNKNNHRFLAEITRNSNGLIQESLEIRDMQNQFSNEYRELTRDFYQNY